MEKKQKARIAEQKERRKYEKVFMLCDDCIKKEEKNNEGMYAQMESDYKLAYGDD